MVRKDSAEFRLIDTVATLNTPTSVVFVQVCELIEENRWVVTVGGNREISVSMRSGDFIDRGDAYRFARYLQHELKPMLRRCIDREALENLLCADLDAFYRAFRFEEERLAYRDGEKDNLETLLTGFDGVKFADS
jgi:hypothetical protein